MVTDDFLGGVYCRTATVLLPRASDFAECMWIATASFFRLGQTIGGQRLSKPSLKGEQYVLLYQALDGCTLEGDTVPIDRATVQAFARRLVSN